MRKPRTWVLYKWERLGKYVMFESREELKVESKDAWQSSKNTATVKPDQYRATWLAESTDKDMLEKMRDMAKEN